MPSVGGEGANTSYSSTHAPSSQQKTAIYLHTTRRVQTSKPRFDRFPFFFPPSVYNLMTDSSETFSLAHTRDGFAILTEEPALISSSSDQKHDRKVQ